MSSFRTVLEIPKHDWDLTYSSKTLMIGSCFTENIGQKLITSCFDVVMNPFGIQYNPSSIAHCLRMLAENIRISEDELFFANGQWNHYLFHSRYSDSDKKRTLNNMNDSLSKASTYLKSCDHLIFSFGTAYIYELKENGKIVSNCHKQSNNLFKRYRLSPGEIINEWKELLELILSLNPSVKISFTVSPIRHIKDGLHCNQLSKSTLLLAIDRLCNGFGSNYVNYFPSYELIVDDLRDYRFYESDMVHISTLAIEYIWSKFKKCYIPENEYNLMKQIEKLTKSSQHRPFNKSSETHQQFIKKQLKIIENLEKENELLTLNKIKIIFQQQLI